LFGWVKSGQFWRGSGCVGGVAARSNGLNKQLRAWVDTIFAAQSGTVGFFSALFQEYECFLNRS